MTALMQGKKGLIMGVANDHSIAWGIAKELAANGAELAFTYQGEALKRRVEPLAQSIGVSTMIECDVTNEASMDALFEELKSAVPSAQRIGTVAEYQGGKRIKLR